MKRVEFWFDSEYTRDGETAKTHREAYHKSLKSKNAVRLFSGEYYYRGYQVSKDGGTDCPWNYRSPNMWDNDTNGSAETKKQAMEYIDDILDNQ